MIPKWMGPYEIVTLKDKLAQLRNLKTNSIMASLINVDRLKLYKEASTPANKRMCDNDYNPVCQVNGALPQEENKPLCKVSFDDEIKKTGKIKMEKTEKIKMEVNSQESLHIQKELKVYKGQRSCTKKSARIVVNYIWQIIKNFGRTNKEGFAF